MRSGHYSAMGDTLVTLTGDTRASYHATLGDNLNDSMSHIRHRQAD